MSILGVLRRKSFWLFDTMRGGVVRKAYEAIKIIDQTDSDDQTVREYQEKTWQVLKKQAVSTTDFYAPFANKDFSDFPIINKNVIRAQQDRFMSSSFQKDKLIHMTTSGSTGAPFVCYQNAGKKKRVNAECIYYSEKGGYKLGENMCKIRANVKGQEKSKFKQFVQNQTVIDFWNKCRDVLKEE